MPDLSRLPKTIRDQLPRNTFDALNELSTHEDKILRAMKDPRIAKLFAEDPAEALKAMKVPVNALLFRQLKEVARNGRLARVSAHFMPNGQTLRPNVRIRFVKGGA